MELQCVAQQRIPSLYGVDIRQQRRNATQNRCFQPRHRRRIVGSHAVNFRRHYNNLPWRWLGDRHRRQPTSLMVDGFAARRRRRSGAAKPGHIDRRIIERGLSHQKIAPDFDRGFGFPDILEKGLFAVKAAPTAGFEQFGEIFQPLLSKSAPARDNVAAMCHVESMCHESARKEKNGRRRNRNESIGRDRDILWKTLILSSEQLEQTPWIGRKP
jgi:hypothetical protein